MDKQVTCRFYNLQRKTPLAQHALNFKPLARPWQCSNAACFVHVACFPDALVGWNKKKRPEKRVVRRALGRSKWYEDGLDKLPFDNSAVIAKVNLLYISCDGVIGVNQ